MLDMVRRAKTLKLPVTRPALQAFGRKAAALMEKEVATDEQRALYSSFAASTRWLDSFIVRHRLRSEAPHNQAGSKSAAAIASDMGEIRRTCGDYDPDCIFNMDETCLLYRLLPNRSFLAPQENRQTARSAEDMGAKERLTVIVCANASGTLKMPLALIGRCKQPTCFSLRRQPPVHYLIQERAWSGDATLELWWKEFLRFVRKVTSKKVLLLVGKHRSHVHLVDPLDRVKVLGFPPNCGSVDQPMAQGVIRGWKYRYKTMLLSSRIDTMDWAHTLRQHAEERKMMRDTMGLAEGCKPHLLDAAELGHEAWEAVSGTRIARCVQQAASLRRTLFVFAAAAAAVVSSTLEWLLQGSMTNSPVSSGGRCAFSIFMAPGQLDSSHHVRQSKNRPCSQRIHDANCCCEGFLSWSLRDTLRPHGAPPATRATCLTGVG